MTFHPVWLPKLTERRFMQQVMQLAKLLHWTPWHDRATNMPRTCPACKAPLTFPRNDPGLPDLILIRRPTVIFAELKSDRGTLTSDQIRVLKELRACTRIEVHVWHPREWPAIEKTLMKEPA